jgi:hypothetical protein
MKSASVLRIVGVLAGLLWADCSIAQVPDGMRYESSSVGAMRSGVAPSRARRPDALLLDAIPPGWQEKVLKVVQQPTISAHGPAEEFAAGVYEWLIDHPDRVAVAWRRLGVPCVQIMDRGQGRFGWLDGTGSDVTWLTVARAKGYRIWYAEGTVRVGQLLPLVPVKAVAVLRYSQRRDEDGDLHVTHEVDIYLQTDSKAAALVTKLIGPAGPRMAEQGAAQFLLFFSAMAHHLDMHPEQIANLMRER